MEKAGNRDAQTKRKSKAPPPPLSLGVSLAAPANPYTAGFIVKEIVKYLLFMRQQIPCTYDELKRQIGEAELEVARFQNRETTKRRRLTTSELKAKKLISCADPLLGCLETLFVQRTIDMVVVLFGSTIMTPRELYTINLHYNPQQTMPPAENAKQTAMRKVIRAFVVSGMDILQLPLAPTKLHLLVRAKRDTQLAGQTMVPKLAYTLRWPKKRPVVHVVIGDDTNGSAPTVDTIPLDATEHDDDWIWFQASNALPSCAKRIPADAYNSVQGMA